ncbi:hypothetical protein SISSUDRAFT_633799 [Sistotremastrum suecicum HHB10207 ss-3]|uniref:Uncharacterized protein n=1 Tax=Sistotremastrum suecicum HHB10207 ss-3 TaxID=1314776 RepID=A0A166EDF8_9AGAM|nr:hypothetical protein SISSUDRAFT_633799 [Sistotremastrum suecicum HHB10207 ss-3]
MHLSGLMFARSEDSPDNLNSLSLPSHVIEASLYGCEVALFALTVSVLRYERRKNSKNPEYVQNPMHTYLLPITATLMLLLSTIHLILNDDIVSSPNEQSLRRSINEEVLKLFTGKKSLPTDVMYALQSLLGDSFIAYRCWIFWNRSTRVILPLAFLFCSLIALTAVALIMHSYSEFSGIYFTLVLPACSLICNTTCSGSMAFKIWRTQRRTQISLWPALMVIVETGLIYNLSLITIIVLATTGSTTAFTALYISMTPLIGIIFNLSIIHIALAKRKTYQNTPEQPSPSSEAIIARTDASAQSSVLDISEASSSPYVETFEKPAVLSDVIVKDWAGIKAV